MSPTAQLLDLVASRPDLADLDPAERRSALQRLLVEEGRDVQDAARLSDEIDGFGPLTSLMQDPSITDICVDAPDRVWASGGGPLERVDVRFDDQDHVVRFVERMFAAADVRIDAGRPLADACLADGSRMHVVLPPIAPEGPLISIRRFPRLRLSFQDLRRAGMFDDDQEEVLQAAMESGSSILISGATGTGKTTLMNALLGMVPDERIVTIEESPELRLDHPRWVSLVTRESNAEGSGAVDLLDLVRGSLRMRPDRIVVGEVRGGEAAALLEAASTGHRGCMATIHARGGDAAVRRLARLAGMARSEATEEDVKSAFDLVVQLERHGSMRTVAAIARVSAPVHARRNA